MKSRYWITASGCGALIVIGLAVYSQNRSTPPPPQVLFMPRAAGFLITFGLDRVPAAWDGSVQISRGQVARIQGLAFADGDQTDGRSNWKLRTRPAAAGAGQKAAAKKAAAKKAELAPTNGILISVTDVAPDTRIEIQTSQGDFAFTPAEAPLGAPLTELGGRARVELVPDTLELTSSEEDQDFPALAQTVDELFLAYIEFTHSDRALESRARLDEEPKNFDFLARPAGGDRVKLMRFSKKDRIWSGPEDISPAGEDCMRAAAAVDGSGRLWVIWSANRGGNFDLYARYRVNGQWSSELRLTSDPGTDVNPVAATDSNGRVWLAWQAFRSGNLEVMAMAQNGNRFSAERKVSFSRASDWDPSIAAGPNGEIAVTWDTYDKGDYDVYLRRMRYGRDIQMDAPVPVAASQNFEARSSAAYDGTGRLWVAYEGSSAKWGKDFGAYEKSGVALYMGHQLHVKCYQGGQACEPAVPLEDALRGVTGVTGREGAPNPTVAAASQQGPRNSFPRIAADAQGRIYLTFRSSRGLHPPVGTSWQQMITYYDGAKWVRPVEVPHSDGLLDLRPALAAIGPSEVMMVGVTDHRVLSVIRGRLAGRAPAQMVNCDLYASTLSLDAAPPAMKVNMIAAERPAPPDDGVKPEIASIEAMRRYRATVGGTELQLMRGEFHRHTEISGDGGGDGPLVDAYRYLIDAADMDWAGCCDHDNGAGREYTWWLEQKLTDAYHLGERYVPMFAYERSVRYPEGHRNVVFARRGIRPLPRLPIMDENSLPSPAPDTQMLYRYLRAFGGIVASHTSATEMGTDWRDNDPLLEPVVEIYQGDRQNYEMPEAPRAPTENYAIGGWRPLGFVSLALKKGYRLGFEASSDHISTHMSYCNLWVATRTREAVMEAFRKRRVYGATDNILADVRCGPHFMGEEFTVGAAPVLRVKLVGTDQFSKVHIIRDGEIVYSAEPNQREVTFEWQDVAAERGKTSYYYVRGEQKDGELVWVSPMWITYR